MHIINLYEAKTELPRIVRSLETGEEDVVYIARNGKPVVQMTLVADAEKTFVHRTLEDRAKDFGGKLGPLEEYNWGEP